MSYLKTEFCWKYYKSLTDQEKESKIGKHLRCMCEVSIRLLDQLREKENELRDYQRAFANKRQEVE